MTPVLRLLVVVRIEVEVVEDHGVGGSQVDAEAACSGGQYEDKNVLLLVELINKELPLLDWRLPIKTEVPGSVRS